MASEPLPLRRLVRPGEALEIVITAEKENRQ
jgi:hypothetical protein